tara:strand:+ start:284 stop:463 length:180 start_codon:yes stop_codon:yes gene_type:complete
MQTTIKLHKDIKPGNYADVMHDEEVILRVKIKKIKYAKAICEMDGELYTFPVEVLAPLV